MTRRVPAANVDNGDEGSVLTTTRGRAAWSGGGVAFIPEAFYRPSDGIDWGLSIQRAIDAATAAGGGVVKLGAKLYTWDGTILVKNGVTLEGVASSGASVGLKAMSGDSRLQLGEWTTHERPGGLRNLRVNGNSTGDIDSIILVQGALGRIDNVYVHDAAGGGIIFDAAQNMLVTGLDIFNSGGPAFTLDNGCGGLSFIRCESRGSNGHVLFTDGPGGNAYPFGPAHNDFKHCIFETGGTSPDFMIKVDCGGSVNRFSDCGFSVNGADTVASGYMVEITNPIHVGVVTTVLIDSAYMVGGAALTTGFYVGGVNALVMTGRSTLQQMAVVWETDGASTGTLDGSFEFITVTDKFNALSGGSFVNWSTQRLSMQDYRLPTEAPNVVVSRRDTDSAFRYFRDRDGTEAYGNGSSGATLVTSGYNATTNTLNISSLRHSGKVVTDMNQYATVTAAGSTVSLSAGVRNHIFALSGTGTITTMNPPSSPVNGQELEVWIAQIGSGHTYVWASNMRFAGGTAPTDTTNNTITSVSFKYYAAAAIWIETGRAVAVPYT